MLRIIVLAAVALGGTRLTAKRTSRDRIRLLIVDGKNNHDWPRATKILKEILEE